MNDMLPPYFSESSQGFSLFFFFNLSKKCLYLFTGFRKGKKSSRKRKLQNSCLWQESSAVTGSGLSRLEVCSCRRSLPGGEDGSPGISQSVPSGPPRLAQPTSQLSVSPSPAPAPRPTGLHNRRGLPLGVTCSMYSLEFHR